jgi:hypothetical protein
MRIAIANVERAGFRRATVKIGSCQIHQTFAICLPR